MSQGTGQHTLNSTHEFNKKRRNNTNPQLKLYFGNQFLLKSKEDIQGNSIYLLKLYHGKLYKTELGDISFSPIKAANQVFPSSVTLSRGL